MNDEESKVKKLTNPTKEEVTELFQSGEKQRFAQSYLPDNLDETSKQAADYVKTYGDINPEEFGANPFTFGERFDLKLQSNLENTITGNAIIKGREFLENSNLNRLQSLRDFASNQIELLGDDEVLRDSWIKTLDRLNTQEFAITKENIESDESLQFDGWEEVFDNKKLLTVDGWKRVKERVDKRQLAKRVDNIDNVVGGGFVANLTQQMLVSLIDTPVLLVPPLNKLFIGKTFLQAVGYGGITNAIGGQVISTLADPIRVSEGEDPLTLEERGFQTLADFMAGAVFTGAFKGIGSLYTNVKGKLSKTDLDDKLKEHIEADIETHSIKNDMSEALAEVRTNPKFLKSYQKRKNGEVENMRQSYDIVGIKEPVEVNYRILNLDDINLKGQKINNAKVDNITDNPNFGELTDHSTIHEGIPLVNSLGDVVNGNQRLFAMDKMNLLGTDEPYKKILLESFPQFERQITNANKPVLVRQIKGNLAKQDIKKLEGNPREKTFKKFTTENIEAEQRKIQNEISKLQDKLETPYQMVGGKQRNITKSIENQLDKLKNKYDKLGVSKKWIETNNQLIAERRQANAIRDAVDTANGRSEFVGNTHLKTEDLSKNLDDLEPSFKKEMEEINNEIKIYNDFANCNLK